MRVFANPTVQSTFNKFNAYSFDDLRGFEMYSSNNTTFYYVMDYGAKKVSFKTMIDRLFQPKTYL